MPTIADYIYFIAKIISLLLGFNNLVFLTLGFLKYKNVYLKYLWVTYLATTVMLLSHTMQFITTAYTQYAFDFNQVISPICMSFIILNLSFIVTGLLYEDSPKWIRPLIWFLSLIPLLITPFVFLVSADYYKTLYAAASMEFYFMLGLNCVSFLVGFNRLSHSYKKLTKPFTIILIFFVVIFMIQILFDLDINPLPFFYFLWGILLIIYFWKNFFVVSINKLSSASLVEQYHITDREKDIADLIVLGKSNKAIGEQLFISEKTVKNHIYNLYKKLGINSRFELMGLFNSGGRPR